jgi:hypothetical protein
MRAFSQIASMIVCTVLTAIGSPLAWAGSDTSPAMKKFEQALEQTENLHLPLNRAYLYRQAASAVSQRDKAEAVLLLKRALSEIDAADAGMRAAGVVDDQAETQLEMGRRATILQLLRMDSSETLRLLAPPQAADSDMNLQRQVFERVGAKSLDSVRDAAQRKLEYGVTPAVVAAYDVLSRRDAGTARLFGASIVFRLKSIDPAQDPLAVTSAFALLKLQKGEGVGRESRVNPGASLLDADALGTLYTFIGDAFLEALDPQVLALTEKPAAYMQAMQQYAPEKADEVSQAILAASASSSAAAKSAIPSSSSSADAAAGTSGQTDAEALTPDEQKQREAAKAQVQARLAAQIKETSAHTRLLSERLGQKTLTQEERDNALFAMVEETNRSISLGRALAKDLEPEAFKSGELEFYSFGSLTGVVESVSSALQRYALDHPDAAEDAASRLDGPEVQTEVELQIAIREMNRRVGDSFAGERGNRLRQPQDEPRREMPQ